MPVRYQIMTLTNAELSSISYFETIFNYNVMDFGIDILQNVHMLNHRIKRWPKEQVLYFF